MRHWPSHSKRDFFNRMTTILIADRHKWNGKLNALEKGQKGAI